MGEKTMLLKTEVMRVSCRGEGRGWKSQGEKKPSVSIIEVETT